MKKKPEGMGAIAWLWEKEKEERRNKIMEKEQLKERRRLNKIIRESRKNDKKTTSCGCNS
jgi:hypothetical protein